MGFTQLDEQVQQNSGVEATGERDMPGLGLTPGVEGIAEMSDIKAPSPWPSPRGRGQGGGRP